MKAGSLMAMVTVPRHGHFCGRVSDVPAVHWTWNRRVVVVLVPLQPKEARVMQASSTITTAVDQRHTKCFITYALDGMDSVKLCSPLLSERILISAKTLQNLKQPELGTSSGLQTAVPDDLLDDGVQGSSYRGRVRGTSSRGCMPLIVVKMLEGRSIEQKRRLAREITNVSRSSPGPPRPVDVIIEDYPRENWPRRHIVYTSEERVGEEVLEARSRGGDDDHRYGPVIAAWAPGVRWYGLIMAWQFSSVPGSFHENSADVACVQTMPGYRDNRGPCGVIGARVVHYSTTWLYWETQRDR
jgi:4-oxalocrotonate tautomerase